MFSFGIIELIIVAVLGIVFVPPHKLPEMMRGLGRLISQLKNYQHELRRMMNHYDAWQNHLNHQVHATQKSAQDELKRSIADLIPEDSSAVDSSLESPAGVHDCQQDRTNHWGHIKTINQKSGTHKESGTKIHDVSS